MNCLQHTDICWTSNTVHLGQRHGCLLIEGQGIYGWGGPLEMIWFKLLLRTGTVEWVAWLPAWTPPTKGMPQLLRAPLLGEHPHNEALLLPTYNCNFPDSSSCLHLPSSHRTPPSRAWPCLSSPLPLGSRRLQHGPHWPSSSEGRRSPDCSASPYTVCSSPVTLLALQSRLSAPASYKGAQNWAQHSQGRLTSAQHGALINCNNAGYTLTEPAQSVVGFPCHRGTLLTRVQLSAWENHLPLTRVLFCQVA